MVPAITEGGRSFKGAALYYLHDKRQAGEAERSTADRVAWIEAVNLTTDDPDRAWRIMADTAMSQAYLKAASGEKATGRKLTKPVFAYSLAWHPDEKPDQAEQLAAARASLKELELDGHQALIIAHRDEPHAHVHVLVNRVNPENGKAATLSKSKLKLSQWAERYEKERGRIFCEQRVENNAKRQRGEPARQKRTPRPEFEFNQATGNDNLTADFIKNDQQQKDAQLYAAGRAMKDSHARQWAELKRVYAVARGKITDHGEQLKKVKVAEVKDSFRPAWANLFRAQKREQQDFAIRERGTLSWLFNAAVAYRMIRQQHDSAALSMIFALMSSRQRRLAMDVSHELARRELTQTVRDATRQATESVGQQTRADLDRLRNQFLKECAALRTVQDRQYGETRTAWKQRNAERRQALAPYRGQAKKWSQAQKWRGEGQGWVKRDGRDGPGRGQGPTRTPKLD